MKDLTLRPGLGAAALLAATVYLAACGSGAEPTLLITNARVVDGTGEPAREASVRIRGDRITAVGALEAEPGEAVVDAGGRVLAPGFIDTHSHHDRGLLESPDALGAVSQGITTIVVGQDGGSDVPLADFFGELEASPPALNVASYVGHGTLRRRVLGDDFRRAATEAEMDSMARLVRADMEAGALGLSSGLEYDPGIYATPEEVVALAREVAPFGGRYISHVRSEDRYLFDAVDELIRIGREAEIPVQVSHMKLAMHSLFGRADELLARLDSARADGVEVTADVYPYTYWQSTMTVLFPERDFDNRDVAEFALTELTTPEGMLIAQFEPDTTYVGMTLADIAELRGTDAVTTYMDLIADALAHEEETGDGAESVVVTAMDPDDVRRLIAWPHTNISSDGALHGRHPRGFGAFPRVLGRYVRDEALLPLEEAVHKMTALSAEHVGIAERGVIRPGAYADLVLFDPDRIIDRATPEHPWRTAIGIERVWVNGVEVYRDGEPTGERPGRIVRRATSE